MAWALNFWSIVNLSGSDKAKEERIKNLLFDISVLIVTIPGTHGIWRPGSIKNICFIAQFTNLVSLFPFLIKFFLSAFHIS